MSVRRVQRQMGQRKTEQKHAIQEAAGERRSTSSGGWWGDFWRRHGVFVLGHGEEGDPARVVVATLGLCGRIRRGLGPLEAARRQGTLRLIHGLHPPLPTPPSRAAATCTTCTSQMCVWGGGGGSITATQNCHPPTDLALVMSSMVRPRITDIIDPFCPRQRCAVREDKKILIFATEEMVWFNVKNHRVKLV